MAYTKHTWENGEVITAAKLNNIEDGCGGSQMIVNDAGNGYLDKTALEIYNATTSGIPVYLRYTYGGGIDTYSGGYSFLAPIAAIYTYNYGGLIRIAFSRPSYTYSAAVPSGSDKRFLFFPSIMIFSAESPSSYPEFYTTVAHYGSVSAEPSLC